MAEFVRGVGDGRIELEQSIVILVLIRRDAVYVFPSFVPNCVCDGCLINGLGTWKEDS